MLRRELIDQVPKGPNCVLEVGCGEGLTGAALKDEGRAHFVAGVELNADSGDQARKVLDHVIVGDIEHIDLPFSASQFDIIMLGDVLEHLVDPWMHFKRILTYLKYDGIVIVSLPNVRNWKVVFPLLFRGEFKYREFGILDKTHLRFFTRKGMQVLFRENNLKIKKVIRLGKRSKLLSSIPIAFISELFTPQYVFVCTRHEII